MKLYAVTHLLCIVSTAQSSNILGLFPHPGKSHFDFFRPLFLALAKAGHDVTIVSYFPNKEPIANYTDLVLDGLPIFANTVDLKQIERMHFWMRHVQLPNFFVLNDMGLKSCEAAFKSNAIREILQSNKKYDVVLAESFINDCMLGISYKLNASVIGLTSGSLMPWHYKRMGSPFVSSFMPNHYLGNTDQMGFLQRLNNEVHQLGLTALHDYLCQRPTNAMIRKYLGDSIPPVEELTLKISAMLINQHFSLNGPTPYVPGIIEVGGLHIQEAKPLDSEIKQMLDNAKNGVIYISWGSLVRPETLPEKKKIALVNALAKFDQLVLLKWPKSAISNVPKNIYLRDWMPQRDILCHPNVKVFMTHGGLLGSTEGCYCGVSLVVMPLFGDQFLNAAGIAARNAGVILQYSDLQEEHIVKAIQTALSPSFQEQAKFISETFRNRPKQPLDLAIWWVEHIIRTKGAPLGVNASSRMNWVTYNNLDVYAVLLLALLIFIMSSKWLIKKLFCFCKTTTVKQKFL